jgi:hypothetical protein
MPLKPHPQAQRRAARRECHRSRQKEGKKQMKSARNYYDQKRGKNREK